MIIAAHISAASLSESILYNSLIQLAKDKPALHFILLLDEKWASPPGLPTNIELVKLSPAPKNGLMLHYWHSFKLTSLLKKHKATHFISETGAISLRIAIPQFLLLNNIYFLQKKPALQQEYSRYIKKYFQKFLDKAANVLVTENFLGDAVKEKFPAHSDKIKFVGHGLDENFKPVDREEKERFLEQFSEGTEYFVAECSQVTQPNILSLVKAFSLFKKRQKSGMKLVLLLKGITIEACIKDFHLYKYRDDVEIVSYTNNTNYGKMLAASYGAIYLPFQTIAENTGLHALAAGTALISIENAAAISMYGDAALYASTSEKSIAEYMMTLYKDEALKKELIEKGLKISVAYNWLFTSRQVWQAING